MLIFLWLAGISFALPIIMLPVIIALQMLLTLSLSYWVAALNVFFRDVQHLVGVFLFLFFYLTPIFYNADVIPKKYQFLYNLNPLLQLLDAYRIILLDGSWPVVKSLLLVAASSLVCLFLGYHLFKRASHRFVEEL